MAVTKHDDPHPHTDAAHDPAATSKAAPAAGHAADKPAAPPTEAPPKAPEPPKPRTFKPFQGAGKPRAVLVARHTAGGDTDFLVATVDNSIELLPGMILTTDEVKGLGSGGFEVTIHAALANTPGVA